MLGEPASSRSVGAISLQPHQLTALARIERAFAEFGGALLSDEVGMGKTFVAAAVARRSHRCLVVAPASLVSMWQGALATSETKADLISFDKLTGICAQYDLVIVDEAHHARNPATRRYKQLTRLTREAQDLLLTATPDHNRKGEMQTLLSLFLGSRARRLTAGEIARCVIRRAHAQLERSVLIPTVSPVVNHDVSDDPRIVAELMSLPPPIAVRDGGLGGILFARGLVHQWASSEAALHEAVRRRIARASALVASLESGNYPTEAELRTWVYEDGALQLGFPELLSAPVDNAPTLLETMRFHTSALHEFLSRHSADSSLDAERTDILLGIRKAHPGARIVAFARYGETVSALYRRMVRTGRVAMLTAHGARVAGGKLSRQAALAAFAPRAVQATRHQPAEDIDLLLATDLLSEGVNLQDAGVIVHLDVPWTAARLEQRVGRAARMGSRHSAVSVHLIRPPASAATLLGSEFLIQRKWNVAKDAIGSSAAPPFACASGRARLPSTFQHRAPASESAEPAPSVPERTEKLLAILESWRRPIKSHLLQPRSTQDAVIRRGEEMLIASVVADRAGWVAAASVAGKPILIASLGESLSTDVDSLIAACLLADGKEVDTHPAEQQSAVVQIQHWFERESATAVAGLARSSPLHRERLVNRIDAIIESSPPHLRTRRAALAARARLIATAQHSAAIEEELNSLAHSLLPDEQWLSVIAAVQSGPRQNPGVRSEFQNLHLHALILLRGRHRRDLVRKKGARSSVAVLDPALSTRNHKC
jgi:superfamily II DNA or RNA helicase